MALPLIAAGIGGLTNLLGGLFGGGGSDYDKQKELIQETVDSFRSIGYPLIEAQKLALQKISQVERINPQLEAEILQGPSEFGQIQIDPRLKASEDMYAATLKKLSEGGLSLQDRADLGQLSRQYGGEEHARQEALIQSMQQRGIAGAGPELQAGLSASQAAAEQQARASQNIAAQTQARALQSIEKGTQLAQQRAGREFEQGAQKASAGDVIAATNVAHQRNVQTGNAAALRRAQEIKENEAQRIKEYNAALADKEQQYNKELFQQDYKNRLAKAELEGKARNELAASYGEKGKRKDTESAGIMSGLGTLGGAVGTWALGGKPTDTFGTDDKEKKKAGA